MQLQLTAERQAALQAAFARGGGTVDIADLRALIHDYAEMRAIFEPLEELRQEEGAEVVLCCDNPDFDSGPGSVVEVANLATNYEFQRFTGTSLADVLNKALAARRKHEQNRSPT